MRIKYTKEWLISVMDAGEPVNFLHFWGHTQKKPGVIDQSCLSQWYPAKITVQFPPGSTPMVYPSVEHYIMERKAWLFGDDGARGEIFSTPDPAEAKRIGRRVRNFQQAMWDNAKLAVAEYANLEKFKEHREMGMFLVNTGDKVLVEASPFDKIWGIGLGRDHPDASDPRRWPGENLLGFLLMDVRDMVRRVSEYGEWAKP